MAWLRIPGKGLRQAAKNRPARCLQRLVPSCKIRHFHSPYSEFLSRLVTQRAPSLSNPKVMEDAGEFVLTDIVEEFNRRFSLAELKAEILRQFHGGEEGDLSEEQLREQEFAALLDGRADRPDSQFVAELMPVPDEQSSWIQAVRKVTRLREVRALYGFSRLFPTEQNSDVKLVPLFPDDDPQTWLPAIETLGEGLFISVDREQVAGWATTDFAQSRYQLLDRNADAAAASRNTPKSPVDIAQVLLHTLSHMVIDQLARCWLPGVINP